MSYDSDKACDASARMWLRIARLLDKAAIGEAEAGRSMAAIVTARCADVCYWQATGEGTSIDMKDVISS